MNTTKPWEYQNKPIYFCGCVLDSETQTIQTRSEFIRLRSKLWHVLIELIENPNKLIHRSALIDNIWYGNNYTGEQGLTHAVCHLRSILKKLEIQAKIITIPKKGYMFRLQEQQNNQLPKAQPINIRNSQNEFIEESKNKSFDKSQHYYNV